MIAPELVRALPYEDKVALAEWQKAHEGDAGFVCAAIRRLPLDTRLAFAVSENLTLAWRERERRRVMRSPTYFIEQYGSVEPPTGKPVPFDLWDSQLQALRTFLTQQRVIVLKARRLGLSWLALHLALWIAAFGEDGTHARILILSKNLDDAKKLLARIKSVNDRLPPFLRAPTTGQDSTSVVQFRNATITVMPATEGAARQETATLVILDEFAFPKNGVASPIWTAVQPTIEGGGRIIVISTGNGRTGDGATFARLWLDAHEGRSTGTAIFIPWHARPDRTKEWIESERRNYESDEAFFAEYPETPDQALSGDRSIRIYPIEGVAAAAKLGEALSKREDLVRPMLENGFEIGTDWGDFQTFSVYGLPLPGGGFYIYDELMQPHVEPQRAAKTILEHDPGESRHPTDRPWSKVLSKADAAPAGTNSSFVAVLEAMHEGPLSPYMPEQHVRVPFSVYKQGGNEHRGVNTIAFLKWLFRNSAEHVAAGGTLEALTGCIAIDPRCRLLLAQLRNLERDPETGKVRKPSLDPKRPETGDHGPDATIALAHDRAEEWQAMKETEEG